jgi:uncharacterized protein (UPF0262 family)
MPGGKSRISSMVLQIPGNGTADDMILRDLETALRDLKADSFFQPAKDDCGPYDVTLSVEENRLVFRMRNSAQKAMPLLALSLKPYKRLIKDYFLIVRSHGKALREGQPSRIEAIDMGRRSLHNEGAELLMERLAGRIAMDMDTARRLFTLICVLHPDASSAWR